MLLIEERQKTKLSLELLWEEEGELVAYLNAKEELSQPTSED